MRLVISGLVVSAMSLCLGSSAELMAQNPRETKVKNDREAFANDEHWIYNDLEGAIKDARQANKPLMIVFRCIP